MPSRDAEPGDGLFRARGGELAGRRVLIVEDEFFLALELEDALQAAGAEIVGPIGSLEQALEQVGRDGFDLAVLDINLGGDLAYSVADALLEAGLPFLFATAYGAQSIPSRYRDHPRIEKPYRARELVTGLAGLGRGGPGPASG